LVLTARHCVSYLVNGLFTCTVRGELIEADEGAGRLGAHLPAAEIEVFGGETPRNEPLANGERVLSTFSTTICTNDLAFLVLNRQLSLPVSPLRLGEPAKAQELATLVGYGLDGVQSSLDYTTAPRQQKTGISIAAVGPDAVEDVTSVPPRTVILEGPSGCTGDSGGPLLAASSGAVLGVYSLQNGDSCAEPDVKHQMVHVPAFSGLIAQAFEAAGHEPVLESELQLEPDSAGAAGATSVAGTPSEAGASAASDQSGGAGGAPGEGSPSVAPASDEPSSSCSASLRRAGDEDSALLLALIAFVIVARGRRTSQRRPSSGSV
jgi:Trypsin